VARSLGCGDHPVEELRFPDTRNEDWHFTSVRPDREREFAPLMSGTGP